MIHYRLWTKERKPTVKGQLNGADYEKVRYTGQLYEIKKIQVI